MLWRVLQLLLRCIELDREIVIAALAYLESPKRHGDLRVIQTPRLIDFQHGVPGASALWVDQHLLDLSEVLSLNVLHLLPVELSGIDQFAGLLGTRCGECCHWCGAQEGGCA